VTFDGFVESGDCWLRDDRDDVLSAYNSLKRGGRDRARYQAAVNRAIAEKSELSARTQQRMTDAMNVSDSSVGLHNSETQGRSDQRICRRHEKRHWKW
jgi:hypothetical protein